ncbi:NAD(P)/FAD-dependent oxidoreductase [Taibaiella soli]|uniref:FAD-binding oxidoreductase n=1 Tax=Taibaiella soli TaxID=1649169 RepID=A0A2W2C3C8_9BACT|nr:FAD-binding oxidoreductase [Taibaiella soli]PZF74613.1 FAD-binding oxidoreductase [Taibaiella soli]
MDLRTDYPFWLLEKGIIATYPSLVQDLHTEVLVIGAGISGALVAWRLCKSGIKTVVVDKRHVGMGSTAASTALLQYEIDVPLRELIPKIGQRNAEESYLLGIRAIDEIGKLSKHFAAVDFQTRPSLQYASYRKDYKDLKIEYQLRKNIGIDIEWLEQEDVKKWYGFEKAAAVLSANGAVVNAYGLTHALLLDGLKSGLQVYDHTEIISITNNKRSVSVKTGDGYSITARKLVIACGYESNKYLARPVDQLSTTYAIVSEPFAEKQFWHQNSLIWETATPYLYLRTTDDHRILIGGKDDNFTSVQKRNKALSLKAKALETSFCKLFPHINFKTDFRWAGVFATTKDGLPYIGNYGTNRHIYFALGFGGNGIIYSQIASNIIHDLITGKKNNEAKLFSFDR